MLRAGNRSTRSASTSAPRRALRRPAAEAARGDLVGEAQAREGVEVGRDRPEGRGVRRRDGHAAPSSASSLSRNESIGPLSIPVRPGGLHGAPRNAVLQVKGHSCPQAVHELWKVIGGGCRKTPTLRLLWKPWFQGDRTATPPTWPGEPASEPRVNPMITIATSDETAANQRIQAVRFMRVYCQGSICSSTPFPRLS